MMRIDYGQRMENTMELLNPKSGSDSVATLKRWLENRNEGRTFTDYLHEYGCQKVAIIDAGEIGKLIYNEFKESDITVEYFIDRNAEAIGSIDGIPVEPLRKISQMPKVDIVIVSTIYNYDELNKLLVTIDPEICTLYLKDAVYEF